MSLDPLEARLCSLEGRIRHLESKMPPGASKCAQSPPGAVPVAFKEAVRLCSEAFGVTETEVWDRGACAPVVAARHAAWKLLFDDGASRPEITRAWRLSHGAAHHGIASANSRIHSDRWFAVRFAKVDALQNAELSDSRPTTT